MKMEELNTTQMQSIPGGNPLAVVFAVYTLVAPIFAAGVATGVADAVDERNQ